MANDELVREIKEQKAKGLANDAIKAELRGKSWSEEDINGALALTGIPAGPSFQFKSSYVPPTYKTKEPASALLTWTIAFVLLCGAVGEFTYWYESKLLADSNTQIKQLISEATTSTSFMPSLLLPSSGVSKNTSAFPTVFGKSSDAQGTTATKSSGASSPSGTGAGTATVSSSASGDATTATAPVTTTQSATQTTDQTTVTTPDTTTTTNTTPTTDTPVSTNNPTTPTDTTPPVITLCMDTPTISSGGTVNFTWNATDVASCTASDGWSGTQPASGSQTFSNITADTTYTLQCTGNDGSSISQSQSVTVQ